MLYARSKFTDGLIRFLPFNEIFPISTYNFSFRQNLSFNEILFQYKLKKGGSVRHYLVKIGRKRNVLRLLNQIKYVIDNF